MCISTASCVTLYIPSAHLLSLTLPVLNPYQQLARTPVATEDSDEPLVEEKKPAEEAKKLAEEVKKAAEEAKKLAEEVKKAAEETKKSVEGKKPIVGIKSLRAIRGRIGWCALILISTNGKTVTCRFHRASVTLTLTLSVA